MLYELTAVILIGGQSSRMGSPKHLLKFVDGKTLFAHLVDMLTQVKEVKRILSVSRTNLQAQDLKDDFATTIPIESIHDDNTANELPPDLAGPAAGILAAHFSEPDMHLLVVACDFPLLESVALRQLLSEYQAPVTCFQNEQDFSEPLLAIWSPDALVALAENACSGKHGPNYTVKIQNGKLIKPSKEDWLFNANTPEEWNEALRRLAARHPSSADV